MMASLLDDTFRKLLRSLLIVIMFCQRYPGYAFSMTTYLSSDLKLIKSRRHQDVVSQMFGFNYFETECCIVRSHDMSYFGPEPLIPHIHLLYSSLQEYVCKKVHFGFEAVRVEFVFISVGFCIERIFRLVYKTSVQLWHSLGSNFNQSSIYRIL